MSVRSEYSIRSDITRLLQTSSLKVVIADWNCIFIFNCLARYLT